MRKIMEDMGELHDQQITDSPVGSSHPDLMSPHELSPSISRAAVAVSVSSMIDAGDFRSQMSEPTTYQTLNGRMSPAFASSTSYATLTPLQPLPPISTVSDKFSHYGHPGNVSGSFTLMQNNGLGMGMNAYQYEKLSGLSGINMSPPHYSSGNGGLGLGLQQSPSPLSPHSCGVGAYSQNGLHSPTKSLSPDGYDSPYATHRDLTRALGPSPQSPTITAATLQHMTPTSLGAMPTLNGLHTPHTPPSHLPPPGPGTPPTTREASIPSSSSSSTTPVGIVVTCGGGLPTSGNGTVVTSTAAAAQAAAVAAAAAAAAAVAGGVSGNMGAGGGGVGGGGGGGGGVSSPVSVGIISATSINCGAGGGNKVSSAGATGLTALSGAVQVGNGVAVTAAVAGVQQVGANGGSSNAAEVEEINTKELAQRISAELKRYSIPQAIFAQRVLCRSQGTLSDLLRNPKPWSKLKSGRETFRRMWKWLQEPEFQRMSALRLADGQEVKWGQQSHPQQHPLSCPRSGHFPKEYEMRNVNQRAGSKVNAKRRMQHQAKFNTRVSRSNNFWSGDYEQVLKFAPCKRKEEQQSSQEQPPAPKKPRLVFTDLQRRTLQAIFKETKRPSKEMQITISQQLGLELSTVGNFFMNARRRSQDKWQEEADKKANHGNATSNSNTNPSTTKNS